MSFDNGVKLFPNPGIGKYNVLLNSEKRYNISVINMYGSKLKSIDVEGRIAEINIEEQSAGLYIFIIKEYDGKTENIKVIKE